jgi:uncharacterized protein (TIRG00374 family)
MKVNLNVQKVTAFLVALFIVAGVLIVVLDWNEMRQVIGLAKWSLLLPALLFMATSYLCLSYSSALIFRMFGVQLNFKELLLISFVSNVVTYLMNVGGATGVSLQFVLLKKRGLATQEILAASLFQLVFSSIMLIALLPVGLFTITTDNSISGNARMGFGIAAGILTLLLLVACVIVFKASVRSTIFHGISRVIHFITRRNVDTALNDFDVAMTRGVSLIRHRPAVVGTLLALTIGDWASTVICLWFCFYALGKSLVMGTLLTGFSLGITAGFISLVPGGLGIQEGSMAGIYALLGVSIRTALLAAILFRIIYITSYHS